MQNTAGLCWALSHETKASDRKALLHLALRILTLPPIVIGVTLLLMYAPTGLLTRRELLLCEVFLLVIPLAAYPLREIFHIGKDRRRGQRGTALVCSAVGYLCGFLWSMLTPCSWLVRNCYIRFHGVVCNGCVRSFNFFYCVVVYAFLAFLELKFRELNVTRCIVAYSFKSLTF